MKTMSVRCPGCNRVLEPEGEMRIGEIVFMGYQCEHCYKKVTLFGEEKDLPLTFLVDHDGNMFDPAEPDGRVRV